MANPPITIGPFPNVPAPGSPIKSDWPQQISKFVAGLQWGQSALASDSNACVYVALPRLYTTASYMIICQPLGMGSATTAVARHIAVVGTATETGRFLVRYFDASGAPLPSVACQFQWLTWGTLA